jgi:gas vesicle protein
MNIQSYFNGLLTGVIIGVLFAPRSGTETRRRLSKGFDELKQSDNEGYQVSKKEVSDEPLTSEEKAIVKERARDMKDDMASAN